MSASTTRNEAQYYTQRQRRDGRTSAIPSGDSLTSSFCSHSGSLRCSWAEFVKIPPSMIAYHTRSVVRKERSKEVLTWDTWMFCLPNSFARLCDNALNACFPDENELVVTFPRTLAVASVKINDPLLPFSSTCLAWDAWITFFKHANTPPRFVCATPWTSSRVISRNGF